MNPFLWLKRLMPRSIYGRAALILIVPVLTVQLVVSANFIQRHYDAVTVQMARALTFDLNLILDEFATRGAAAGRATAEALRVDVEPPRGLSEDARAFYDLSGRVMTEVFRDRVPDVVAVDLRESPRHAVIAIGPGEGRPAMDLVVERRRISASNPHQLLVIMASTGILMTGLAYLFLRNQLKPIRKLAGAAEDFGKGRKVPFQPAGATEVRSAGRAFLEMRGRIESQIEQRTMMLSGVSHDLRTPLTRMRLGLSMLEDDGSEIAPIIRDVDEMEGLLDTFLDFARGEALDDPSEADPAALAQAAVADARRGGGAISYKGPETAGPVHMRPMAVQRALGNLVSNALRYGDTAVLSVKVFDRALRFSVEDDGPGIPPESREAAVQPFSRLDTARNQDRGSGVGLGLAIVNDIARRHGGTLRLGDSKALGGLRVDLVLPR